MSRDNVVKIFKKSLWVFHLNTGSCNGCDIEILNVFAPFQDAERFGVKLVGSPRHADAILLSGPITREALPRALRAFQAVPEPKIVLAIGSCACGGGIWYDSYNIIGGVQRFYEILREKLGIEPPPTFYVPGCPPKPEAILYAIGVVRGLLAKKQVAEIHIESLGEAMNRLREVITDEYHRVIEEYVLGKPLVRKVVLKEA